MNENDIESRKESDAGAVEGDAEVVNAKETPVAQPAAEEAVAEEAAVTQDSEAETGKADAEASVETDKSGKPDSDPEALAVADEPEPPKDTGPPKKWYVVHTYSGHENKVKENIQKMINASSVKDHFGQIIVPTEEVAEMKKGKKTITTRKFFPSYILIEMCLADESRHIVSDIPGVTSFVGTAAGPQPLSKAEVERILGRMDKEKQTIIPEIPFSLGEHVRIKDGPFSDFTGIVDEINADRGKLKVLVSIFGRETPVELDFLQVESI